MNTKKIFGVITICSMLGLPIFAAGPSIAAPGQGGFHADENALAKSKILTPGEITIYSLGQINSAKKPEKPGNSGGGKPQTAQVLPWGIDRIDADEISITGEAIKVAVIDSGINNHQDLENNLKGGINFTFPGRSSDYSDKYGHGTHVAGTIAALDNEIGVVGVAPDAHLYAVKVLNDNGVGNGDDLIRGIDWAIENRMDVINMSLGFDLAQGETVPSIESAMQRAYDAGIVLVAAGGNYPMKAPDAKVYPAAYETVIAVSAIDNTDFMASFSVPGDWIELTAPGANVYSTYRKNDYKYGNGTSMASPHVAGTAALVLASAEIVGDYNDDGIPETNTDGVWTNKEVRVVLQATAELLPELNAYQQGYGLVDAKAAVNQ